MRKPIPKSVRKLVYKSTTGIVPTVDVKYKKKALM